jgi:WXG100 family type VII secretion target
VIDAVEFFYQSQDQLEKVMSQIRMSPELLREKAVGYRQQAVAVEAVITKMDRLLMELENEWLGEASKGYSARYAELRPGFVKAQQLISEISESLEKAAVLIEQADSDIARAIGG